MIERDPPGVRFGVQFVDVEIEAGEFEVVLIDAQPFEFEMRVRRQIEADGVVDVGGVLCGQQDRVALSCGDVKDLGFGRLGINAVYLDDLKYTAAPAR